MQNKALLMRYILILIVVFLFSCSKENRRESILIRHEFNIYSLMKIDSSLNISQKFSIEIINGRYVNDSTEVRVVYCLSGEKNEFRLRGKRNEFACGNNVYRITKRNGGLRITPWLIAKKDSCVHFKPSDFLKITELNCFVNNIEKNQKYYLYNFKYLPDGAESVKLYDKRYRLIKEVFETKTYIPFNSYISVQKQLIYSNVY